eukprot:TRINITY_DN18804_c0_g1_i1.p1 TRINITY_DN18804_c0_g1~~TRINITY_DN18804_c0_g1_i1.p1  ORF type:complete len:152 (-),score=22.03 TRINITY_DN18804_c0_g1_i1:141-596(-)
MSSFLYEWFSLVLNAVISIVVTVLSTILTAAVLVDMNSRLYANETFQSLGQSMASIEKSIPPFAFPVVILVLPALVAGLCARPSKAAKSKSAGRSMKRTILGAIAGGILLGVLISRPPGPYSDGFKDADVKSAKKKKSASAMADRGARDEF